MPSCRRILLQKPDTIRSQSATIYASATLPSFSFCLGYTNGFRHGAVFASVGLGAKPSLEISEKVELAQLRDVVLKYLDEHPEDRHLHAAVLVQSALAKAFPPQK
jgi:hypothetical protein